MRTSTAKKQHLGQLACSVNKSAYCGTPFLSRIASNSSPRAERCRRASTNSAGNSGRGLGIRGSISLQRLIAVESDTPNRRVSTGRSSFRHIHSDSRVVCISSHVHWTLSMRQSSNTLTISASTKGNGIRNAAAKRSASRSTTSFDPGPRSLVSWNSVRTLLCSSMWPSS